jgi:acetyl esterase/lipase
MMHRLPFNHENRPNLLAWLVSLVLLVLPACRASNLPLWHAPRPSGESFAVERIRDIPYYRGPGADGELQRLDLYLPQDCRDYPVVVLVHGGAWTGGDNRCFGLYSAVGEFLARQGIAAALPNYRLSPQVLHPEHARDVARAVAWVHAHIAEHGGRPEQLFLAGHSAGGHLVALLATDEKYLKAEGLHLADVRGVIGVSGIYFIPEGNLDVTLGGDTSLAFRPGEMVPLRCASPPPLHHLPGIPLSMNLFGPAFGYDPQVRADASPINHVRPGLPPFLLFSAENDLPTLSRLADDFCHALQAKGCEARHFVVAARNHHSIMFRAIRVEDPVGRGMVDFIREHAAAPELEK